MNIAITGAGGFLGQSLVAKIKDDHELTILARENLEISKASFIPYDLYKETNLSGGLKEIDVLIHLAALTNIQDREVRDEDYVVCNTEATIHLAKQAEQAGVKRFIFMSSIKVNGESTASTPSRHTDRRMPEDIYACTKSKAEELLMEFAKKSSIEIVIIRPPLIYGPGVKGNFRSLMKMVSKGIPLPFRAINKNKRSVVFSENLVDLLTCCLDHRNAANQIFLVSDDHDLSTADIIRNMASSLGKKPRLLYVPLWVYRLAGKVMRKEDVINRLVGSLQVDISHTKETLGWSPPYSSTEGFNKMGDSYLKATQPQAS